MNFSNQDYLKKTLLDTQERVRDFMKYKESIKDQNLKDFFQEYAETEASQARCLQKLIDIQQ